MIMIMRISRNIEHNKVGFQVKHSEMELHLTKLNTAENVLLCVIRNWVASVKRMKTLDLFLVGHLTQQVSLTELQCLTS